MTTPSHLEQAITLYHQGHPQQSLEQARQGLRAQPDHYELLNLAGAAAHRLGVFTEAERYWRAAIASRPDGADAHANLGILLKEQGRLEEAEALLRRAVALRPDSVEAHLNLGHLLGACARPQEAEAAYRQASALRPQSAEAHYYLGTLLHGGGRLDEAEAAYRRAGALHPPLPEAHNNLGNLLKDRGHPDQAEAAYRQALALRPGYAAAHNNLAGLLKARGRPDEAEAAYRQALALHPAFAEAHYNLGRLLEERARLPEAAAAYRRAIDLKHDDPAAVSRLTHLAMGGAGDVVWAELRDIDLQRAAERTLHLIGLVALGSGHAAHAIAAFARMVQGWPDNLDAHQGLAAAHYAAGDVAASERLTRALARRRPVQGNDSGGPRIGYLRHSAGRTTRFDHGLWVGVGTDSNTSDQLISALHAGSTFDVFVDAVSGRPEELPRFDLLVNLVADPDSAALAAVEAFVERVADVPLFNPPDRVRACSRNLNATRFQDIDGLRCPRALRAVFNGAAGLERCLGAFGLTPPFILRVVGTNTGKTMRRVDSYADLSAEVAAPYLGRDVYAIEFVDFSDAAGLFRKYRVYAIGARLVPVHCFTGRHWDVHGATALTLTRTHPEFLRHQCEFLRDSAAVVGARGMAALAEVARRTGLDLVGIDFSLTREGGLLLFEANPAMNIAYNCDLAEQMCPQANTRQVVAAALRQAVATRNPALALEPWQGAAG